MDNVILPGNPPIEVVLRVSPRARRLSLRVSRLDRRVTLSLPKRVRWREAEEFARDREDWIRRHLDAAPTPMVLRPGAKVMFGGVMHDLVASGGRAAKLGDGVITLPLSAPEKTGPRLAALFKHHARLQLHAASDRHADTLGRGFSAVTLRDTRSRWGSCSAEGRLMFSWRLIMAPPEVLDYVAAHEVAHLVEMNHSPDFWANVERLCSDYHQPRRWLRENGPVLHAYRFRD
ncbi:MAG: M48 family metallopeptidase [Rhodobacteraceae bacterium]|nr:M48 family metallopeptidase [Paracoccaceae bacterium]